MTDNYDIESSFNDFFKSCKLNKKAGIKIVPFSIGMEKTNKTSGYFSFLHRFALFLISSVLIGLLFSKSAKANDEFLDPSIAFPFIATMQDKSTIAVTYQIADGYYMYRDKFKFEAVGAKLGAIHIPPGKIKFDETFQKNVETYRHDLTILIPVDAIGSFTLNITDQGCADKGLCYAPRDAAIKIDTNNTSFTALNSNIKPNQSELTNNTSFTALNSNIKPSQSELTNITSSTALNSNIKPVETSELSNIELALKEGHMLIILPLFMLLGLGLSFTPCVLPMVPILSFIIVGEGTQTSRFRGFVLSLTYTLGMAIVYTSLGVAAGLVGEGLAATLQNPLVLGTFAIIMGLLSLSMFGVYQLQVPTFLQEKLVSMSNRQSSGKLVGVFIMGAISALIVGPCVTAPLAGALVYISQTQNVLIGGSALFAMAVGMSVPLLLVGISAGTLLPKAGLWMEAVKQFFGVLLLIMAWWLLSPILPTILQMLGWSALGIGYGMYLLVRSPAWWAKSFGLVFTVLGLLQLVGVSTGGRDALNPLAHFRGASVQSNHLEFTRIKTIAQLDSILSNTGGKTVMLDFYADWCVSCKEMEKFTFTDPQIQARLNNSLLLQVDVTANTTDDKAMLKRFNLFGPPGIIFFDGNGNEISNSRVIGYQEPKKFLESLNRLP